MPIKKKSDSAFSISVDTWKNHTAHDRFCFVLAWGGPQRIHFHLRHLFWISCTISLFNMLFEKQKKKQKMIIITNRWSWFLLSPLLICLATFNYFYQSLTTIPFVSRWIWSLTHSLSLLLCGGVSLSQSSMECLRIPGSVVPCNYSFPNSAKSNFSNSRVYFAPSWRRRRRGRNGCLRLRGSVLGESDDRDYRSSQIDQKKGSLVLGTEKDDSGSIIGFHLIPSSGTFLYLLLNSSFFFLA